MHCAGPRTYSITLRRPKGVSKYEGCSESTNCTATFQLFPNLRIDFTSGFADFMYASNSCMFSSLFWHDHGVTLTRDTGATGVTGVTRVIDVTVVTISSRRAHR